MSKLAHHAFAKMNGIGNEIIVLDLRGEKMTVSPEEARAIHAGQGLAYDQLMVLQEPASPGTDAFMRIFNNDGSESGACGNGTRCVAYMLTREGGRSTLALETRAGLLDCRKVDDLTFSVDMGPARLLWQEIPLAGPVEDTCHVHLDDVPAGLPDPAVVNMGNPHAIFFVADAHGFDLPVIGPKLEHHPMFPERVNVSLAQVLDREHILLRVWERGAGITQACGTAACATLVAAARLGLTGRKAWVSLPGGDLVIEWREADGHVIMTGPVEMEFEGRFDPALFAGLPA
jgi:diaminopimelate epimerase